MKTKEEFLQEAYGYKFEEEDFLNPAIRITLNAMEKYAQEVVNNLDKADVSHSTDDILPKGVITDGYGNSFSDKCNKCKKHSMQVVRIGEVQCKYCG